jgi:hypothetical protein
MTEMPEDLSVALSNDVPMAAETDSESMIDEAIASLWTAHQEFKGSAKQTKLKLQELRRQLGERLWAMKCVLVCSGRAGSWAAYLRTHRLPRATADRYVNRHQESMEPTSNRLNEAIDEPTMEDVKKLVQKLMPRPAADPDDTGAAWRVSVPSSPTALM